MCVRLFEILCSRRAFIFRFLDKNRGKVLETIWNIIFQDFFCIHASYQMVKAPCRRITQHTTQDTGDGGPLNYKGISYLSQPANLSTKAYLHACCWTRQKDWAGKYRRWIQSMLPYAWINTYSIEGRDRTAKRKADRRGGRRGEYVVRCG